MNFCFLFPPLSKFRNPLTARFKAIAASSPSKMKAGFASQERKTRVTKLLVLLVSLFIPSLGTTGTMRTTGETEQPIEQPLAQSYSAKDPPDTVFLALEHEVNRAMAMNMGQLDKPYWAAAYAQEVEFFNTTASFGALMNQGAGKNFTLDSQIRVGTPALDNTNFTDDSFWFQNTQLPVSFPNEPNYDAIRHALWLQFDQSFKSAVEIVAKKKAFLKANEVKDRPVDFAAAPLASLVQKRKKLSVDTKHLSALAKKTSAIFLQYPEIYDCRSQVIASTAHQSLVSSEKIRHRFVDQVIRLQISAYTQADDGMKLAAHFEHWGRTENDFPSDSQLLKEAELVAKRLVAIRNAPLVQEDYAGPVLFIGQAAPVFFLIAAADPLGKPRDELGNPAQGRLIKRLGKRIASKILTVRDDPTISYWKNQPLIGHYPIDDDSVLPMPITLIKRGVLRTYYMSRIPTNKIAQSNGHSRNGVGAPGNVFVNTSSPQSRDTLIKRLLDLVKEEDLDYGLIVENLDISAGVRSRRGSELSLPNPLTVWRIFPDGRREQVRGLTFKQSSYRLLKDIDAMGDQPHVVNTELDRQRTSVLAPAVLVKLMELQRVKDEHEKPPRTPRPRFTSP